ncbi:MAG: ABC transporter substrate-binding protein [Rhizobiales bacterium]|nr:ABC transporter substrate-binding protein [Hyphomicrobiales bacterium]
MKRRDLLVGAAAGGALSLVSRPALVQPAAARTLRFVPQANLAHPDPVWSTATMATINGFMIWDTLYGVDKTLTPRPQMCAGSELSSDELTWTFTLRDGLMFHDNTPVRAADCVMSIKRWAERNPFGQLLWARLDEISALDDRRFQLRLKRPFPPLLYALAGTSACFMMPERMAATPSNRAITEFIGSGPYRFLPDQWVSGVKAEYARFEGYRPRQEAPDCYAGGKVAHFDRVLWSIQPDPATAAAALRTGEVDWVEQPLLDLVPSLKRARGVKVDNFDPMGTVYMLIFNQLQAPFNNEKLRRALLPAVDQTDFVQAIVGDQKELGRSGVGYFPLGSPSATTVGMEALTGPRDLARARQLVAESGYAGEPVVVMEPSDVAPLSAISQLAADLFKRVGLNVRAETMDLATMIGRRNKQEPVGQGGWSCFPVQWSGLPVATPLSNPLSANGRAGWIGWPTSADREALRGRWLEARSEAERKDISDAVQREAFSSVPFIPACQYYQPAAYRDDLTDFVRSPFSVFWGVRRV